MNKFLHLVGSHLNRSRRSSQPKTWQLLSFSVFTRCLMVFILSPVLAFGGEATLDVSKHISEHRAEFVEARVVALPIGYYFQFTMPEKLVNKFGCSYPAESAQEIAELLDILAAGQVIEVPKFYEFGPDPRLVVYLKKRDGSSEKLLFESTLDKPMQEYGIFNRTNIRAMNPEFPKLLRAWASARKPVITRTCKQNVLQPTPQS